jgi:hypothetical protein
MRLEFGSKWRYRKLLVAGGPGRRPRRVLGPGRRLRRALRVLGPTRRPWLAIGPTRRPRRALGLAWHHAGTSWIRGTIASPTPPSHVVLLLHLIRVYLCSMND